MSGLGRRRAAAERTSWRSAARPPRSRRGPSRVRLALGATLLLAGSFAAGRLLEARLLEALAARSPDTLLLRRVAVVGAAHLAPDEVASAARVPPAAKLVELDRATIRARLVEHPWVKRARVLPLPPATLLIAVREREPVAVTPAAPSGALALVDRAGIPFAPATAEQAARLPRLVAAKPVEPARPAPALVEGARIADALQAAGLPEAAEIVVGGAEPARHPSLRLRGLPAAVVLGPGALETKLARLAGLLDADLPEARQAGQIDLRFAGRAILRASPPRNGVAQRRPSAEAGARPTRGPSARPGGPDQRG